jgi:acetyl-CoA decarbonylase/synthase complex subunit beta
MFKDIPVEVGVIYEGERIRKNDMQVELGGPSVKEKFELAKVRPWMRLKTAKSPLSAQTQRHERRQRQPTRFLVERQAQNLMQALKASSKGAFTVT